MSIPDAFSLNSRAHRPRRRSASLTRSPPSSSISLLAHHHAHTTTSTTSTSTIPTPTHSASQYTPIISQPNEVVNARLLELEEEKEEGEEEEEEEIERAIRTSPAPTTMTGLRHRKVQQQQHLNGLVAVNGNGVHTNGHANGVVKSDSVPAKPPPIDWEIPRKVFHSSIGFLVIPLYTNHVRSTKVALVLSVACTVITLIDVVRLRNPDFARLYEKVVGFLMRESEKQKTNGVIWYLLGCIFVLACYPEDIAVVSILILSWCDTTASTFGRMFGRYTPPLPRSIPMPFPIPFLTKSTTVTPTSTSSPTSSAPSQTSTSYYIPLPFARRKSTAGFIAGAITGTFIVIGFWTSIVKYGRLGSSLPRVVLADSTYEQGREAALGPLTVVAVVVGLLAGVAEAIDIGSLDDNLTLPIISGGIVWALFKAIDYFFP